MRRLKQVLRNIWISELEVQSWDSYLLELNIRRLPCVAAILVIFQTVNLVLSRFSLQILPALGSTLCIIVAVVYGFTALCLSSRIVAQTGLARFFYLSFWILLYVGFIPFFIHDIINNRQFTNVILFFSGLCIVPVFTKQERMILIPLFFAITILIAFFCHASMHYIVYLVLLGFSAFLLSYAIQGRSLAFLKRLLYEAYCDVLTGVLNRRGGLHHVKKMLDNAKLHMETVAFFMVDIDFFKNVNDAHGHRKGDEALVIVANTLKTIFNGQNDILCRIGGEEFLVCTVVNGREEAGNYAERLLQKIESWHIPTPRQDASPYLTVSVGIRIYQPECSGDVIDELALIDDADAALYRAKGNGRNRYEIC